MYIQYINIIKTMLHDTESFFANATDGGREAVLRFLKELKKTKCIFFDIPDIYIEEELYPCVLGFATAIGKVALANIKEDREGILNTLVLNAISDFQRRWSDEHDLLKGIMGIFKTIADILK